MFLINTLESAGIKFSLRRNLLNLALASAVFILVAACFCRSEKDAGRNSKEQAAANQNGAIEAEDANAFKKNDSKNKKTDEGDFLVEHIAVKNARYIEIDRQVKQEKLLESAADKLNRSLRLPYDISLRTKDCGEINAFYEPGDHSITVCYELMEHFYKLFKGTGKSDRAAYDKMFDAVRFAFLHEIGHALIDAYQLPVTGNEEDAADRCSSYICLTELGEEGVRSVLAAADGFSIESKDASPGNRNMADEHLLREQRFYNTLCMIYGSDTEKYSYILKQDYLPHERAVRCPSELERVGQSWSHWV